MRRVSNTLVRLLPSLLLPQSSPPANTLRALHIASHLSNNANPAAAQAAELIGQEVRGVIERDRHLRESPQVARIATLLNHLHPVGHAQLPSPSNSSGQAQQSIPTQCLHSYLTCTVCNQILNMVLPGPSAAPSDPPPPSPSPSQPASPLQFDPPSPGPSAPPYNTGGSSGNPGSSSSWSGSNPIVVMIAALAVLAMALARSSVSIPNAVAFLQNSFNTLLRRCRLVG